MGATILFMVGDAHLKELRESAIEFAQLGGKTAARYFGNVTVARKADNSPVTEADHATQDAILKVLSRRYPTHAILVEEDVAHPDRHSALTESEYCWIIDPIDGTRNFSRGVRVYATSIAVMRGGRPLAGAIYDASSDVVYSAAKEQGAFRGNDRVLLNNRDIDRDTTIALGSFRRRQVPASVRGWLDHFLLRNFGSTSLHLAWVALGLVDAAYSAECKIWDVAAAALLIEEAGGTVTGHSGRTLWPVNLTAYRGEDTPVVAGTTIMHSRLLPSLRTDTQFPRE